LIPEIGFVFSNSFTQFILRSSAAAENGYASRITQYEQTCPGIAEGDAGLGSFSYTGEVADEDGFHLFACHKRTYANLGPIQIGFVLHFLFGKYRLHWNQIFVLKL